MEEVVSAADLIALAERVEKAEGPDREIDKAIQLERGYSLRLLEGPSRYPGIRRWYDEKGRCISWFETSSEFPPRFTASLDAGKTLLAPATLWAVGDMEEGPFARLVWPQADGSYSGGYVEAKARTAPNALTAAALRARAAQEEA